MRQGPHGPGGKEFYACPATLQITMKDDARETVLAMLQAAVDQLERTMHAGLIPEVGTNIAFALPDAREKDDVAAVEGRIVRLRDRPCPVGPVAFGASDHVAAIVLTAMKFDPEIRSAANIRYSPELIGLLEDLFLEMCSFDRKAEPPGTRTMDWGVAFCCKNGVPDIIFDRGAVGKEPMVRVLAENPIEVATIIGRISTRIGSTPGG
jgi:predicted fused transcriptional regulator/phosphomethylpyrimidine kinase